MLRRLRTVHLTHLVLYGGTGFRKGRRAKMQMRNLASSLTLFCLAMYRFSVNLQRASMMVHFEDIVGHWCGQQILWLLFAP